MGGLIPTTPHVQTDAVHHDTMQEMNHDHAKMRQPLQTIPSASWSHRPRLIASASAPPELLVMSNVGHTLTPPSSPLVPKPECGRAPGSADRSALIGMTEEQDHFWSAFPDVDVADPVWHSQSTAPEKALKWNETVPRACSRRYQLLGSASSGFQEYGRGVWSIVYRAVEAPGSHASGTVMTPPTSPQQSPAQRSVDGILAVKAPSRRDAHAILEKEARILTFLHSHPGAASHLVPFHGYDEHEHSLILAAIPLNLEHYTQAAAATARLNFSTRTMFDPVIGVEQWTQLAAHLIDSLNFLHRTGCVHGDIKPANILLHPTAESLTPLLCDFSSASVHPTGLDAVSDPAEEAEEVSAVTTEYTSPELLTALHRGTARAIATPASDVFALAVTLLVAAMGESPYASARMEVQKLGMAKEGRPLDFARGGENASRAMRGRMVDRILTSAVEKNVEKRLSAEEWRAVVDGFLREKK